MQERDILYLFHRIMKSIFYPKGNEDNKVIFEIPADFLVNNYFVRYNFLEE